MELSQMNEFDIQEYGLSDGDIIEIEEVNNSLRLHLTTNEIPYLEITKEDALDIAKHFGIIKGDENE